MQDISYLTQAEAVAVDEELMGPLGFSVDQLMELAGLSVACSVAAEYPASSHKRVLVLVGPGNNGGDGLVAARHLTHFGYTVDVCYPKRTDKPLYHGLVTQCMSLGLRFREAPDIKKPLKEQYDVVIDALFGFSFKGTPRPPFDALLECLSDTAPAVVSVDIPSGWNVEEGPGGAEGRALQPDMLVSLTAPKLAAKHFKGRHHFLGGRFVPPAIRDKYKLKLPPYPGTTQCVKIPSDQTHASTAAAAAEVAAAASAAAGADAATAATAAAAAAVQAANAAQLAAAAASTAAAASAGVSNGAAAADMRISYEAGGLLEEHLRGEAMAQFDAWFAEATACKRIEEPNAMALASCSSSQQPSARMVLLKGYDERGFTFYTNYDSRKGRELAAVGKAALCFFWEPLQRSVRIEGLVERLSEAESTAYFQSRPRGSQIGAWVSAQSQPVHGGRAEIEAKQKELEQVYENESIAVPKPPHWGGFLVRPLVVEFWQGRPSRLHDRLVYGREAVDSKDWQVARLYP